MHSVPRLRVGLGCLLAFCLITVAASSSADEPQTRAVPLHASGQTMGTHYSVTLYDPSPDVPADWPLRVDRELRLVNDQMSTYLADSEVSRFNRSSDLDWFRVSGETAIVVAKALEVYRLSDGAFDVTVGRLVNLWSFGPQPRPLRPPPPAAIEQARASVGSDKLEVRLDPPAIRKTHPELQIDLSAIAKGHGVDRVTELLQRLGAQNAFVDIGGEVRASGHKADEAAWVVGIQKPDQRGGRVVLALPLRDQSVATSGDYRNFFEFEGKRYSHTIDPRSGRPIEHGLASVTVLADDCMSADAWATAITVLGYERGQQLATQQQLSVLLIDRQSNTDHAVSGTGDFQALVESP